MASQPALGVPIPAHTSLVVRQLLHVSAAEREQILKDVEYNVFAFPAGLLTCDFLSDSGTSAMTDLQWAAMLRGDESYGRNWGYYCLLEAVRDIFERGDQHQGSLQSIVSGTADIDLYRRSFLAPVQGVFANGGRFQLERPNFFIVPQGRCAESLFFSTLSSMRQGTGTTTSDKWSTVVSNGFFDTTSANAGVAGFALQTFTQPGLNDPFPEHLVGVENPFKGNLDIAATADYVTRNPDLVAMILVTITNNWAAAQPVSMANIREAADLAKRNNIPLVFDACRFAENAWFIHKFEPGYSDRSIPQIVQEMFSHADAFMLSLKKDGLSNMGGLLCLRDQGLIATRYSGIGHRLKERQILCYGNDSYGGMSGRDLMAAAVGLYQVTKETYLHSRIGQVQRFAQRLLSSHIKVLLPPGGHAVYLDMDAFFHGCDRHTGDFASVGFTLELIKDYGIRALEAGAFGWGWDLKPKEERDKIPNLVRFSLPRYVMSDEHIAYTVAAIRELYNRRHSIPNVVITRGKESRLRHFAAGMKPVPVETKVASKTWLEEASRQLTHLAKATGQREGAIDGILTALKVASGPWGQQPVPPNINRADWVSNVSDDHSPIEYSVSINHRTGDAEVRFLIEAQPESNTPTAAQNSVLALNTQLNNTYNSTISLDRFNKVRDIFWPNSPENPTTNSQTGNSFAAWHSFASTSLVPTWKIYLNPASSPSKAKSQVSTAMHLLGLSSSWNLVSQIISPSDNIFFFALDLTPSPTARVKIYIGHPGATATEIAHKHACLCPDASSAYEIQRFLDCMAGGDMGPYRAKSALSCFAFTSAAADRPVGTVYFPAWAYAMDDAEIQDRVHRYGQLVGVCDRFGEQYRGVIAAVQRRPLREGCGIHAWISLKQERGSGCSTTFYVSPEMFGFRDCQ